MQGKDRTKLSANLMEFLFCRPANKRKSQRTFGTFASSDTQAEASACKRAKFLPTLNGQITTENCKLQDFKNEIEELGEYNIKWQRKIPNQ